MGLFTFIICFLILLLILIIIGTIQEFALWITTRKHHEFVVMIIPALVSLIIFSVIIFLTYYILSLFNIYAIDILFAKLMKWEYNFNNFISILLGCLACSVIYIALQALILQLVNINYKKIYNFVKYKIMKKEEIKELVSSDTNQDNLNINEDDLLPTVPEEKIPFFNYLAASLFTFALFFFSTFLLIFIGIMIGEKYIL